MSRRVLWIAIVVLSLSTAWWLRPTPSRLAIQGYGIGRTPTAAELAGAGTPAFPDGRGLPKGHGSAREGRAVFTLWCASCHGERGEGLLDYPQLAGGRGTLGSQAPVLTVGSYWPYATTLWDYTHRAMPYPTPGILKTDEVYAVTAFVLYLNGIVREDEVLDERSLPRIRMPNRNGFVADVRP